ncbi:MAG: hypothetical protein HY231_10220 [Acidobacteria bacterium]|nr:hypothetical protein [Acidobacteriota bacterium]
MSVSLQASGSEDIRVTAGERLVLRVRAFDPAGIGKIFVQCFQFSTASTNKVKLAYGQLLIPIEESFLHEEYEIYIDIPINAAYGKWGIQTIEFTNGRGYKTSFYRGQSKFDNILFDVVAPPTKEDELLKFNGIEIAGCVEGRPMVADKREAFHKSP